ncbi:uncharacterized protein DUF4194 [Novosphingobium sp. PhB165]|uniref:DUF4194 domain-containing protein n=1 Tax=Novosphingobium sp. PhB165 TaxID=2485105 RepID=UPI0010496000|nr:DUF4194 domain-containing protein [Novosphingobium sp. PhB165]TCM16077.1 uncharacterized protein DUF4194 [Novosphingobium sp. PhB165]
MANATLYDLEELLDRPQNRDLTKEMMVKAADRLLAQQCLFRDDYNASGTYDLIVRHKGYFGGLFDALGRDLVIKPDEMMIELRPQDSLTRTMLSLDETIILLALRATFEQGVVSMSQEEFGLIATTSMEVLERYDQWVARPRPPWPRVRKILEAFRKRRFIDLGEDIPLENGVAITIRPAIRSVTGEAYQARIAEWIAATHARQDTAEIPGGLSDFAEDDGDDGAPADDAAFTSDEGEDALADEAIAQ